VSIQHDLETDEPMVDESRRGICRPQPQYDRGTANIMFAIDELRKIQPNSDYRHLTLVGHSNGGDISMYFAKHHPESDPESRDARQICGFPHHRRQVQDPLVRSRDPVFKADPASFLTTTCAAGITLIKTSYQHNDLSDRGPDTSSSRSRPFSINSSMTTRADRRGDNPLDRARTAVIFAPR